MAVTTAAVIGAGAAVSGAVSARNAGKDTRAQGEAQALSSEAGIQENRRQFDITQANLQEAEQFSRSQQQPFQEAGVQALTQQQALLGLSGQEAQKQAFAGLEESSGQQFLRKRQERALVRNASAIGGLGGGNVRTALQEQAAGFAQQDIQNQFGRLGQVAGQGQAAGASIGAGARGTAGAIGQFGATNVADINQARQAASEARASGIFGQRQANAQGIQQLAQGAGQFISAFNQPPPTGDFSGAVRPAGQQGPLTARGQF